MGGPFYAFPSEEHNMIGSNPMPPARKPVLSVSLSMYEEVRRERDRLQEELALHLKVHLGVVTDNQELRRQLKEKCCLGNPGGSNGR